MKRLSAVSADIKKVFLVQTALVLIFSLSGFEKAIAQTAASPAAVPATGAAPAAPANSAASTTSTTTTTPTSTTTVTTTTSAAPATPAAPGTGAVAPVTSAGGVPPVSGVSQETLPSATKAEAASQPSAAELAIVQNAATLNSLAPVPPGSSGGAKGEGMKVTDILSTPANIRPMPQQYLVVKKEHNATDSDARLMAARTALWQGHYQSALELFDDLYRNNSRDMRVIMGRAVALQKLGQMDEAMDAYQTALTADPHNIEAMTNMLGLLKGQDTGTAIKKLLQLRDMYPANSDVTAQLGMVYGVSGDYANALKYLNMADALKPGNPTILLDRAVAYDHMGNTVEASELYRKILLLGSDGSLEENFPLESIRQRLATIR